MDSKAHNNEDQRLIHTTALPRKANNAVGWANQRLASHRGERQCVPWLQQTSRTEWNEAPVLPPLAPWPLHLTILVKSDHAQDATRSKAQAKGPLARCVKKSWCAGAAPRLVHVVGRAAPTHVGTWNSRRRRSPTSLVYRVRQASSCSATRIPTCISRWLTCLGQSRKCGGWGTPHPALSIVHGVTFAMATPSFPPLPTPFLPPCTSPRVWVSSFATYSLGALHFGLLLFRSSQPHAVVSFGARFFPRKRLSWIIVWRGTTAGSPHGKNNPQGFPSWQHQRKEPGPVWQRRQRDGGCSALDVCLSACALPRQLPLCAQRAFANFLCDPCVATAAYDRHQDSPMSRDSPPRQPYRQPPTTHRVLYLVFIPLSHDSPPL